MIKIDQLVAKLKTVKEELIKNVNMSYSGAQPNSMSGAPAEAASDASLMRGDGKDMLAMSEVKGVMSPNKLVPGGKLAGQKMSAAKTEKVEIAKNGQWCIKKEHELHKKEKCPACNCSPCKC